MIKVPEVSIIITNYNYGQYISRSIRSCLSQKVIETEIIVVDDCSSDDTLVQIQPFLNDITLIQNDKNVGVAEASNIGIKAAKSQFVIRVDADDFVTADMSYFMKQYMEANHDAFCVACDYILIDEQENVIERKDARTNPISCGIMYRRDLLLRLRGYNPDMRHREEEELRKRLGEQYKIHHLRMPFYRYRMHKSNKTKQEEYRSWKIDAAV